MTVARLPYVGLLDLAADLGCAGVELRNDLPGKLFAECDAVQAGNAARAKGLRILALAEVKAFNAVSDQVLGEAAALMDLAIACGAEAVSLIPRNDGQDCASAERRANLRQALAAFRPLLEERHLTGLIEPLGFESSSLRYKSEIVEEIDALGATTCYKLVHDTFHHMLAGDGDLFPAHTAIMHISGVVAAELATGEIRDEHRILVDDRDRLNSIGQIRDLTAAGYDGPISFEAFSPDVHNFIDPKAELARSIHFIESQLKTITS